MDFTESEKLELKKTTSELKEAIIAISAILNKHQGGEIYFGISNDGKVVGQTVTDKTIRDISKAVSDHIEPKIFPEINNVTIKDKSCIHVRFEGNVSHITPTVGFICGWEMKIKGSAQKNWKI